MLSSTEAEYIAQAHATKEGIWLQTFITKILGSEEPTVMKVNYDNQGAIVLAKDNKFHSRTKHIDLQYHFIWEAVEDKKISISYIPMNENVSDVLTKALARLKFKQFVEVLGLRRLERKGKEERMSRKEASVTNSVLQMLLLSAHFIITWSLTCRWRLG